MGIKTKFFFILMLILGTGFNKSFAQEEIPSQETLDKKSSDEQLAAHYFNNREFDKAAIYYEKLFDKHQTEFYYGYLLTCYLETKEFKPAEKLVKKQTKKHPYNPAYQVDLGYIYKTSGDNQKAKKEFENCLNSLAPVQQHAFELASAFSKREEYDYALATYQKAKKIMKDNYPFSFEIAEIYMKKGDYDSMINEYLEVLLISEAYIQQVQNLLNRFYFNETGGEKSELVKNQLLKKIQRYPDRSVFSELLIWQLIQERDFNSAFIQVKALDKRLKEDGYRLMNLAQVSISNQYYDVAVKAYQSVLEKGNGSYYYISAKIELLDAMNKKLTSKAGYTIEDLMILEKNYLSAIAELGRNAQTAPLLKGLAHLYGFYINDAEKSIALLEEVINIPGITQNLKALAKLELADIYLLINEVWEASLLYSQVEKSFKHDPLGDEAKLRNAKLSYFVGDFKWAQAQLDVLKGSTSKLIANDAMQLSLLISDNTTIDTNSVPMELYARADLLAYQNRLDEALLTLDTLSRFFQGHELDDDVLFKRAQIMERKQDYEKASEYYQKIVDGYGYDILADDALFRLAELHHYNFKNIEKAKELYYQIMTDFLGSIYTVESRKRFRDLRGDKTSP
jgi:tetratricopeptide (TPR) repeat protein